MNGKPKVLCIDFEHHSEIYSHLEKLNPNFEIVFVDRSKYALELMKQVKFDIVLTTIVMHMPDGITFIETINKSPEIYGKPVIGVVTGLGGDKVYEKLEELGIRQKIDKFERKYVDIVADIAVFLGESRV